MKKLIMKQIEYYLKTFDEVTHNVVSGKVVFRISHIRNNHFAYSFLHKHIKSVNEYLVNHDYVKPTYEIEYMEYMRGAFVVFNMLDSTYLNEKNPAVNK